MGNSPTQQPYEGDTSPDERGSAGEPLFGRAVTALRSLKASVQRRLSVFSDLDFGAAFDVVDRRSAGESRTEDDHRISDTTTPQPLRGSVAVSSTATDDAATFPDRSLPFTHPSRDTDDGNQPDLESVERNGRLSIYYPDHDEATLTSDTWEPVER